MSYIKHHRHSKLAHDGKRSHINHQVIVTKTNSPLGEQQSFASNRARFIYQVSGIKRCKKLALLDVDRSSGSGCFQH
jgi:hypothetical protein